MSKTHSQQRTHTVSLYYKTLTLFAMEALITTHDAHTIEPTFECRTFKKKSNQRCVFLFSWIWSNNKHNDSEKEPEHGIVNWKFWQHALFGRCVCVHTRRACVCVRSGPFTTIHTDGYGCRDLNACVRWLSNGNVTMESKCDSTHSQYTLVSLTHTRAQFDTVCNGNNTQTRGELVKEHTI